MLRLVRVTGWVDGVYVFPDTIVGDHQRLWIYRPRHPRPAAAEVGGSLEDWSRLVAARAVHSPYLVFGIAVAFASMLLEPLGVESGGFHLHGTSDPGKRSSIGKTLCLRVASSVFGSAARNSLGGWRGSDRGLEDLAATRNDQLLCLDEPRRSSADSREAEKRIRQIAFMIASERGRELAAGYTGGGGPVTWRLLMLSSGEEAIVELVTGGRLKGEEVRFIDLPIGVDPELGIFRRLPTRFEMEWREKGTAR